MYFNVFGEKVSKKRYKEMCEAAKNRRELIAAGLSSRRELCKMGLLTAGGMLVAQSGLSARAQTTTAQTALGAGSGTKTNQPPSSGGQNTSPGTNQNCVPGNQTAAADHADRSHSSAHDLQPPTHRCPEYCERSGWERSSRFRPPGADELSKPVSARQWAFQILQVSPGAVHHQPNVSQPAGADYLGVR